MTRSKPNLLFILADQLRAASLPMYGERQIATPHLDRLAAGGVVCDNMIASCPVCTPSRSMLLTGRYPQSTGHVMNFVTTRHDEIGIADAARRAGYRTGWVGKWHLHRGSFPENNGRDFVPEGRDRLGFQYWRGYNFHMTYFNGWVNTDDWHVERWNGYETDALLRYAVDFLDRDGPEPFCLFVSPHQPHATPLEHAPAEYYRRLPERLSLPANVPEHAREDAGVMYRHYLAMTLAVDDLVGGLLDQLENRGRAADTLVVFASDHGTEGGAHPDELGVPVRYAPWQKCMPHEESLRVPLVLRLPGVLDGGKRNDTLVSMVDLFPTLCGIMGMPKPRTLEGHDLSGALTDRAGAFEQGAVLTMNFTATFDYLKDGREWRGVRTKRHSYDRWLDGRTHLYDLAADPLEQRNLAGTPGAAALQTELESTLRRLLTRRADAFPACHEYADWFDAQRRVVRNARGPLGNPEAPPDWSLFDRPG